MPIKIAIIEDDTRVRDTLVEMLNEAPGMRCVAHFDCAETALKHFPGDEADVALVDINLPGRSGIELVGELKTRHPKLHLVMMTVYEETEQIFNSLQAGATGYLLKRARPSDIINAIHDVYKGGSPMSPEIARKVVLFFHQRRTTAAELENLTKRETEILSLLAKGSLYEEIADQMNISLDTVRSHLQHIYNKLRVRTRTEAVVKYLDRHSDVRGVEVR
jgi:DNA-binding NarL/FixJ family response regulator